MSTNIILSSACCCDDGLAGEPCASFLERCLGSANPDDWPDVAQVFASHAWQGTEPGFACCDLGYISRRITASLEIQFTGTKQIAGFNLDEREWVGTGTYSWNVIEENLLIETDFLTGDCLSNPLCTTWIYNASGTLAGKVACGTCYQLPSGGGSCTDAYRSWAAIFTGSGAVAHRIIYSGSCCDSTTDARLVFP